MIECNRYIHKKLMVIGRVMLLVLPVICALLLLTQVAFAENVYVINDGDVTLVHTTYATDPEQILSEAGLVLGEDDTYTAQTGSGISEITIQRLKAVELVCDGESVFVTTYAEDVQQLLQEQGITLCQLDKLSQEQDAPLKDGMRIFLWRAVSVEEAKSLSTPPRTVYYYDPQLAEDEEVVLREGRAGRIEYLDQVTMLDGQEIGRETIRKTVLCKPVTRIVATGSRNLPIYGTVEENLDRILSLIAPEYSADSGLPYIGNGMIVTTDGEVMYYSDELVVRATAYNNTDPGCTIYTAIGTLCRVGAIAVDPKVIPYGTRMFILTNDGKYVYGVAVAEDCGGAIKGNRVDLYFDTVEECYTFGVRQATVYFIDGFVVND